MAKSIIEYTPMSGDQTLFSQDDELACVAIALRYVGLREQQVERFASGESALVWLSARIGGLASASICNIAVRDVRVTPQWSEQEKEQGIMPIVGTPVYHIVRGCGVVVVTDKDMVSVLFDDKSIGCFDFRILKPLVKLGVKPFGSLGLINVTFKLPNDKNYRQRWTMQASREGKRPVMGDALELSLHEKKKTVTGEFLGVSDTTDPAMERWIVRYTNESGNSVICIALPLQCSPIVTNDELKKLWLNDLQSYIKNNLNGTTLNPPCAELIHNGLLDGSIIMPLKTEGAE